MTNKKPENPSAFPEFLLAKSSEGRLITHTNSGMTLLDYFAGQALMGAIANPNFNTSGSMEDQAENYYRMANAMLSERDKQKETPPQTNGDEG